MRLNLDVMNSWWRAYLSKCLSMRSTLRTLLALWMTLMKSSCGSTVRILVWQSYQVPGVHLVLWVKYLCLWPRIEAVLYSIHVKASGRKERIRTGWPPSGRVNALSVVVGFNASSEGWRANFQIVLSQFCSLRPETVAWNFDLLIRKMVLQSGRTGFGVESNQRIVKSMVALYDEPKRRLMRDGYEKLNRERGNYYTRINHGRALDNIVAPSVLW